jgi:hypothetical protein
MADDEPAAEQPEIILRQKQIGGVWANFAQVSHSQHEFTIDFVRMDGTAPPPGRGIVVARVSMSPLFVTQLIDALQKNWSGYAQKALPREVRDEPEPEQEPTAEPKKRPERGPETRSERGPDQESERGPEERPEREPDQGSERGPEERPDPDPEPEEKAPGDLG